LSCAPLDEIRREFARKVQISAGIKTGALIEGLASVPRENFVGPGPWRTINPTAMAQGYQLTPDADPRHLYDTILVALDADRHLNNGEPASLLLFLDILGLRPGDRLLHIGCGVGYYTAIAAHAVGPRGSVVGIDVEPNLAARAAENLRDYSNVKVISGDASRGVPGEFDAIFVNAGCTHPDPTWLDQLAIGGRLLLPLTVALSVPGIGSGLMLLVTRNASDYSARLTSPVAIFHCEGMRDTEGNALLAKAFFQGRTDCVRRLRRDTHVAGEDCWLHGSGFCLESDPSLREKRKEVQVDAAILANYAGRYQWAFDRLAVVTQQGSELHVQRPGRPNVPVYAESATKFFYRVMDAQITFLTDDSGRATQLVFHQNGIDTVAKRVD
jgi:protein-L-isoaspartate(D-aspartate) O-methyltransferase